MNRNIFIPIIFIVGTILTFVLSTKYFSIEKNSNDLEVKNCSKLNYEESLYLHPNNFSSITMEIKFDSIKQWRRNNLRSLAKAEENKKKAGNFRRFYTDRKRVDGNIIFKFNENLECVLKARIRAHGDLEDHVNSSLPSLNVNLKEGHVFGITKFKLFIPKTRRFDNELIAANLFKELGFLSPRTARAKVKFYNKNLNFIFQESIVKEFIENNNNREFPLYAGDERYAFIDWNSQKGNRFSNYKLENANYIKNEESKEIISKYGLSLLNKINFYSDSEFYPESIDLSDLSKKLYEKDVFEDFQVFSSLMFAMNSNHNLSRDDLRIYFNKEYDKFYPIYYDGTPNLGIENKYLNKNCLPPLKKRINCNFTKSGVFGAKRAAKLIDSLDIEDFKKKLLKYNFNKNELKLNNKKTISISNIDGLIDQIKKNLIGLSNIKIDKNPRIVKIKIQEDPYSNYLNNNKKIYNPDSRKLVYHSSDFKNFLTCNVFSTDCKTSDFQQNAINDLVSQRLKINQNNKDLELNYTSRTNEKNNSIWYHEFFKKKFDVKKKIKIDEELGFYVIGNIEYKISKDQKILEFTKKDNISKVIFENQDLNGWEIYFEDNSEKNEDNFQFLRLDAFGYSGCLNFFDSIISEITVKFFNSKCEDAINFVRSKGIVKEVEVTNSLFDSIDGDFSNLKFKKIKIKKSNNDCLDFSYGSYLIEQANLSFCGDKGVSAGEMSKVTIYNTKIEFSNNGIVSKDFAEVKVLNSNISNTEYCFQAYKKKQEFSGGYLEVKNSSCNKTNVNKFKNDQTSIIKILQ
ncbi:MAG: hypothetical protein CBE14_001865 [Rickettsiales bacterium TMED254]|nr:MAG: hypothetical protein CBE14_001865 [Rickettsiales bacterium TMED254]